MKNPVLKQVVGMSNRYAFAFLLQFLTMSLLVAESGSVQAKSIEEVMIQLHMQHVPVENAFAVIEQHSGNKFIYSDKELRGLPGISLNEENASLYDALVEFAGQPTMGFKQVNVPINGQLSGLELEEFVSLLEYNIPITGRVLDSGGNPLPGASILIERSSVGVVTDLDGNFTLEAAEGSVLVVSFIGYQTQRISVGSQSNINVVLMEDQSSLDEVVVVGYGVQERISLTNSVSQLKGEDLVRRPVANFQQSLQGFSPGVTVLDRGGRPGNSNVSIRVRGITTLGDNNPLIIVDGIEQRISDINPNDIESVTVLKDASSSAIYGSRAANGVILVTTKRGNSGGISVSYDGYYAVQDVINRPEHMDLENYLRLENVAHANAGRALPYTEEAIQTYVQNAPSPEYPLPYPYWLKGELGMLKTAPQQNHTLSVSGGTETVQARMSVRHQRIDGIAPNFSDNLNEFRLNLDLKASEKIKFSADLNYRNSESIQPGNGEGNVFNFMLHASKFSWPKYPTGEYGLGPQTNNPLLFAELTGDIRTRNSYITGGLKVDYEILPGLNFSTQYAMRDNHTQIKNFSTRYFNRDPITGRTVQRLVNSLNEGRSNVTEYTLNSLLNYTKDFGKHGITALTGYSTIDNKQNQIGAFRQDFYNNEVRSLSQGSTENRNATGFDAEWGLRSYFARFNYRFSDKYFLELNARYDGSSRFSEDNRYSFFPSASVGWRISEESFWNNVKPYINEFKLRGSRGITGNQAVGLYTFYETLNAVNYSFNDQPVQGFSQSNLANQNLTWETTAQTNIGFDMGVMEDRFLFTFDYYNKITDGILLQLPIPGLIGLNAPFQNAGVVQNKGYELALNYRGGRKLKYDLGLNFSDNKNEVLDLVNTGPFISFISNASDGPRFIIEEGLPINSHWGYLTDGFFQTQEEADNYPNLFPNTRPGDIKYLDTNQDGIINGDDHEYLGLSFPRFDFGMNANFTYKDFELFFQWQGSSGHRTRLDGAFQQLATFETFTHAIYTDNYWTPERTDARFARPIKGDTRNFKTSDYQMINASYIRLKNIVLGYNIPSAISEHVHVKNAKVYIGATNLFTFSELNEWDLDPEIPSGRGQYYPQVKMYTLGLNVRF